MALKDWKKNTGLSWTNLEIYQQVTLEPDNTIVQIKKVNVEGSWKRHITKRFKTKAQALKFAKSYMRKH